jgi:dUTP pyrophosphatase
MKVRMNQLLEVPVKIYTEFEHEFGLPAYETLGSSGMDVRANESCCINPGETRLVSTGIFVKIPEYYEIQVRPRSGLSFKTGLRVANSPGTIDSDFLGEIKIILSNTGTNKETITLGDRIAQIVLQEVPKIVWEKVSSKDELPNTDRGTGGFGSTGVR